MTDPGRRGRRDNGLAAVAYVPLADVDPRIGDHLLDVLWAAGIPAYLEPPPDTDALRQLTEPTQPVDRLWVDGERRTDARSLVEAEAAQLPVERGETPADLSDGIGSLGADEEAAWAELMTQFASPDSGQVHPWPAAEDLDTPTVGAEPETRSEPRRPVNEPRGHDLLDAIDALDGLGGDESADFEGHFEPPPPPPMPRLSKYALLALGMMVAGVVLLFVPGLAGLSDSSGVFVLGVVAIICGAGLLIWRLKEDRGSDGPDDGAVV